ncbi:MAG: hypothetical protein HC936_16750 [Leptolyngbyaceae cyanobacterium SU_3_3]|nr:hypothetical protein [Leptolyngbyaceae cyanobacterium SU_3_3]NJR49539.1 hypothetical protein [Leptolyngbyaceae cyanobacterium CSU_1_3]
MIHTNDSHQRGMSEMMETSLFRSSLNTIVPLVLTRPSRYKLVYSVSGDPVKVSLD